MLRFVAFFAGLAALVTVAAQGTAYGIALFWTEHTDKLNYVLMTSSGAQIAFFAFMMIGLFAFAVSRRSSGVRSDADFD